jgi:hypothetical protein
LIARARGGLEASQLSAALSSGLAIVNDIELVLSGTSSEESTRTLAGDEILSLGAVDASAILHASGDVRHSGDRGSWDKRLRSASDGHATVITNALRLLKDANDRSSAVLVLVNGSGHSVAREQPTAEDHTVP